MYLYKSAIKRNYTDLYLLYPGMVDFMTSDVSDMKTTVIHNDKYVLPYCMAGSIISFKRSRSNIFTKFITFLKRNMEVDNKLTSWDVERYKHLADRCDDTICYGLDEYFLNNVLVPVLVDTHKPVGFTYTFDIFRPIKSMVRVIKTDKLKIVTTYVNDGYGSLEEQAECLNKFITPDISIDDIINVFAKIKSHKLISSIDNEIEKHMYEIYFKICRMYL